MTLVRSSTNLPATISGRSTATMNGSAAICLASEACALLDDVSGAGQLYAQLAPFAGRHAIGHAEGSVGAVTGILGSWPPHSAGSMTRTSI